MNEPPPPVGRPREGAAVAAITLLGAVLRIWPPGRLGLTHFDEGIYALAAAWAFAPGGLAAIDPMLIPYAPPGFPILAGLLSTWLGRSDLAAIAVSQLAGTLTIPAVARLARRAFGPGSGVVAASACAASGPHVAFSRMALTDPSFLLTWMIALGLGMRFLERPNVWRALAMGAAVGLAQEFKYNGWLAGGIVIGSALLGTAFDPRTRQVPLLPKTFGWGLVASGIAWLVVLPWYRFVENHGGYTALLRHQQSYLGGLDGWWPHLKAQAEQSVALSGGPWLVGSAAVVASLWLGSGSNLGPREGSSRPTPARRVAGALGVGIVVGVFADAPYWLGLFVAPRLLTRADPSSRTVGVWWSVLAISSPFYHPYARLWLPFQAAHWLMMGWLAPRVFEAVVAWDRAKPSAGSSRGRLRVGRIYPAMALLAGLGLKLGIASSAHVQPGLLDPSDSLRGSSNLVATILPEDVAGLRVLVRPPVTYYLAGRVALYPMAGSDQLNVPGNPRTWALVDSAILRSEVGPGRGGDRAKLLGRFAKDWELVEEFPSTLALPTLLDLDPGAARREAADRSAPLWLLRPRRPGPPR